MAYQRNFGFGAGVAFFTPNVSNPTPVPVGIIQEASVDFSFTTKELAESYRARLRAAARRGEGFDTGSGLPESMVRALRDVSFYEHCAEFGDKRPQELHDELDSLEQRLRGT